MTDDATRYDMRTAEITRAREHALYRARAVLRATTRSIFHLLKTGCGAKATSTTHACGVAPLGTMRAYERSTHSIAMSVLPDFSQR